MSIEVLTVSSQAALLGTWSSTSATPSQPRGYAQRLVIYTTSQQDEISMQPLKVIMKALGKV